MKHLSSTPVPTLLGLASALALCACGSSDDRSTGLSALQARDYPKAVTKLETAVAALDPSSPEYKEVAMGHCMALAHVDGQKAKAAFEKLAASQELRVADYNEMIGHLLNAKNFVPAIEIMDSGMKRFPDDEKMIEMKESVLRQSQQNSAPEAVESLKSLGYLGGD